MDCRILAYHCGQGCPIPNFPKRTNKKRPATENHTNRSDDAEPKAIAGEHATKGDSRNQHNVAYSKELEAKQIRFQKRTRLLSRANNKQHSGFERKNIQKLDTEMRMVSKYAQIRIPGFTILAFWKTIQDVQQQLIRGPGNRRGPLESS